MLKTCEWCHTEFEAKLPATRFCTRSCFGKHNRTGKPAIPKKTPTKVRPPCCVCGGIIRKGGSKYCSNACQGSERFQATVSETINTGVAPSSPNTLRRVMFHILPHTCSICAITEWQGQPPPLEVDHIDGNYMNNLLSNLRLICGNCGMQLATYKGRNLGNGRHMRRVRYAKGLSY